MKELEKELEKSVGEIIIDLQRKIRDLEKEIENHKQNIMQDELEIIPKLEEENKKLKAQIEKMSGIGLASAAPTVILDD